MLVERVSGVRLQEFCRREFFVPLGMNSTQWRDNFRRVVPNRAIAYSHRGSEWRQFMPFEDVYGNGGLLSTISDLLKWNRNLASGKLHATLFKQMQQPSTLNSGAHIGYGLGFFLEEYAGVGEIAHPGVTAGYVAWLGRLPSRNVSIALTCNAASADAAALAHKLARAVTDLPPDRKPVISNEVRGGLYVSLRDHTTFKVVRMGNSLTLNGWPNKLNIRSEGDKMIFQNPVFGDDVWQRLEPSEPTSLIAFAGVYTNDEAQTRVSIEVKGGELILRNSPHSSFALEATYADDFRCDLGNIHFLRDRAKNIVGLRLSSQRFGISSSPGSLLPNRRTSEAICGRPDNKGRFEHF